MLHRRLTARTEYLEPLKWLAIVLMCLDHINKFLLDAEALSLFNLGRICLPIFCFVLGVKLASINIEDRSTINRIFQRLIYTGLISTPVFLVLVGWWPLNVLFALLIGFVCVVLVGRGGNWNLAFAFLLFIFGSAFVEYWWWCPALVICSWRFAKTASPIWAILFVAIAASLWVINRNFYALLSIPLIFFASYSRVNFPRTRMFFYFFYPAHLYAIYFYRLFFLELS